VEESDAHSGGKRVDGLLVQVTVQFADHAGWGLDHAHRMADVMTSF
jgi:hypothetical protein